VTGASAGIGEAFSERLAREQYDLILVARTRDRLEALAKRLVESRGIGVEVLPADLCQAADLRLVEEKLASDPTIELLVNNAGFGNFGAVAEIDAERLDSEIRLNVLALVRLTRAVLAPMVSRGRGSIINVSSLAGIQPVPFNANYGATKAFVNSFTEAIHEELRGSGVRVQVLQPGFTHTGFQERAGIDSSHIPAMAWMEAGEVVDASLAALRRGDLVCVPGGMNKAVAVFAGAMPRALVRRLSGAAAKRFGV
jgi:short-subunit dehydrogenase